MITSIDYQNDSGRDRKAEVYQVEGSKKSTTILIEKYNGKFLLAYIKRTKSVDINLGGSVDQDCESGASVDAVVHSAKLLKNSSMKFNLNGDGDGERIRLVAIRLMHSESVVTQF